MHATLALLAASLFFASSAAADVIHACVNLAGKVRIVDGPGKCRFLERHLSWNEQGPAGPPGMDGAAGMDGDTGPPGPAGGGGKASRFEFLGFTSETLVGNVGPVRFSLECQSDYPGSRWCSTEEVFTSSAIPSELTGEAWVRPSIQPNNLDISGLAAATTCVGWTNDGSNVVGLTFHLQQSVPGPYSDPFSGFTAQRCDVPRPAACCAPVE